MKKNFFLLLIISFLTSCSSVNTKFDEESAQAKIDKMILDAALKVQNSQSDLYQAGALNSFSVKSSETVVGENLYSIVWFGDAVELLSKMAKDQGMTFRFSGVRLPLPVSIKSINADYNDTLSIIKSQIGYRAELTRAGNSMVLTFHPNNKVL